MRFISLLCCFFLASAVLAKDMKIGTVDLQKLFKEYPGTKKAEKKFQDSALQKQKDLKDSEDDITELDQELKKSEAVMSVKKKKKKQDELKEKYQVYLQTKAKMENEMEAQRAQMTADVLAEIKEIVSKVAQAQGMDLVLDSEKAVYVKDGTDLTDKVLKNFKDIPVDSKEESSDNGKKK